MGRRITRMLTPDEIGLYGKEYDEYISKMAKRTTEVLRDSTRETRECLEKGKKKCDAILHPSSEEESQQQPQ